MSLIYPISRHSGHELQRIFAVLTSMLDGDARNAHSYVSLYRRSRTSLSVQPGRLFSQKTSGRSAESASSTSPCSSTTSPAKVTAA